MTYEEKMAKVDPHCKICGKMTETVIHTRYPKGYSVGCIHCNIYTDPRETQLEAYYGFETLMKEKAVKEEEDD